MARLLPLKVEKDYSTDETIITALSRDFEPVQEGAQIPEYIAVIEHVPATAKFAEWHKF